MRPFLRDGMTILVHGYSNAVCTGLLSAARRGMRFKVLVTEGQPERDGYKTAKELTAEGIPVEVVLDAAVGFTMSSVDIVLITDIGVLTPSAVSDELIKLYY